MNRLLFDHRKRTVREYLEVTAVIAAVTAVAWFVPSDYRLWGPVYLLAVIAMCVRVGRWPILFAAVVSVLAWNFVIVPPRLAFSELDLKDGVFLGTYFVAALLAGQLTAQIRSQEKTERQREKHATALFQLSRALSSARSLDEAVAAALRHADVLFGGQTAVWLVNENGRLQSHRASSLVLSSIEFAHAEKLMRAGAEAARVAMAGPSGRIIHIPLIRDGLVLGIFCLGGWESEAVLTAEQRDLVETFAAQISLLVEREHFRAASEREKLLAESDRLHRTLLDSVSHELKTPIAVLRAAAENLTTEDRVRRLTLAKEARTATDRLDRLIGNLLNQSRLDSGRLTAQLDWCDARDIIRGARRAIGEPLARRPLTVEIPPDMPLFRADFVLLEQCVANLLSNAVLHTPNGTPIEVTMGTDQPSKRVFITVADRGPGIAPEMQGKLFQKFHRAPSARAGGLGLGLSIVRGFMRAQGGDIEADAHLLSGARFTLYLPYTLHENVPND